MSADLSHAIIAKSDQLNSDDLIAGPITITITKVTVKPGDQPVSIHYEDDAGKPYKPCKSMCKLLAHVWGPDGNKYAGRRLTLYRDPRVKWGGMEVGGIRISHMSHISDDATLALTVTRGNKKPFTVKPLQTRQNPAAKPADARLVTESHGEAGGAGVELPAPEQNRTQAASPLQGSEEAGASVPAVAGAPADFPGDRKEPEAFVYRLTTSAGRTHTMTDGAKWADTLCKWFADDEADAQTVWTVNQEHIKAAFAAPDRSHAERVAAAWREAP
ncbi:MAG TPA: hypothetical protein VG735_07850 [Caulobacterales bacterium]|nr:hypothetical protein [Caulobacterales bacterium]